jgi:hypothetical protein
LSIVAALFWGSISLKCSEMETGKVHERPLLQVQQNTTPSYIYLP